MLKGKHAVVLGGAGFLGSHLCERLVREGAYVSAVDNMSTSDDISNVQDLMDGSMFRLIRTDITRQLSIEYEVDYVLNLASPASPPDYLEMPLETLDVGAQGNRNALEFARTHGTIGGAVFLLTSTSEVYGDPLVHPQHEDYWGNVNPVGPRSVYDESKRYAEAMTMAYHRKHGMQTRIARIFNTYGPRMRPDDGRALPTFMMAALRGQPLPIFGDGTQTRSLCYVDDMVDGLIRLLLSNESRPVNLGNPDEISILDLAMNIIDLVGVTPTFTYLPLPEDDPKRRQPDISRAKETLNWKPRTSLHRGLVNSLKWFRSTLNA